MKSSRILIIDYQETSLRHLDTLIRSHGYETECLRSGREALDVIDRFKPDLCLIDPLISGIDGFTLSQRIHETHPEIVIFISTDLYKGSQYRQDAEAKYGVSVYLEKPYSDEALIAALREHLKAPSEKSGNSDPSSRSTPAQSLSALGNQPGADMEDSEESILEATFDHEISGSKTVAATSHDLELEMARLRKDWANKHKASVKSSRMRRPKSLTGPSKNNELEPLTGKNPKQELDLLSELENPDLEEPALDEDPPPVASPSRSKPDPPANLTSNDIFGNLIKEIESGRARKPSADSEVELKPVEPKGDVGVASSTAVKKDPPLVSESLPELMDVPKDLDLDEPIEFEEDTQPVLESDESSDGPLQDDLIGDSDFLPPISETGFEDPDSISPEPMEPAGEEGADPAVDDNAEDKYQLLEKLHQDDVSETWKAKLLGEQGFEKLVCLRLLPTFCQNQRFVEKLSARAKAVANLSHPHISHFYEMGSLGGIPFLAAEFIEGRDLSTIFDRCRVLNMPLETGMVAFMGLMLCRGLSHAHEKKDFQNRPLNLFHGYLTPAKIFITSHGDIKLTDFESAYLSQDQLNGKDVQNNPYAPPENQFGPGADLYGLAAVLYEGLVLQSAVEMRRGALRGMEPLPPHRINPQVPQKLSEMLVKALAQDPEKRYESAAQFGEDLQRFLKEHYPLLDEKDLSEYLDGLFSKNVGHFFERQIPNEEPLEPPKSRRAELPSPPKAVAAESKSKGLQWVVLIFGLLVLGAVSWYWLTKEPDGLAPEPDPAVPAVSQETEPPGSEMPRDQPPENDTQPAAGLQGSETPSPAIGDQKPIETITPEMTDAGNPTTPSEGISEEELKKIQDAYLKKKQELERMKKKE